MLLLIFIKNSIPGKVKTRLARSIGDEAALRVYEQLLSHTRHIVTPLACTKMVCYSEAIPAQDGWPETEFRKAVQHGSDLGQRMQQAFDVSFRQGYTPVVIIGSDCAELTTNILQDAFAQLQTHDCVIGPARDGGYYLLGMHTFTPAVFQNKAWSTATVFADTLADLQQAGKSVFLLPVLSDIDTVEDLESLQLPGSFFFPPSVGNKRNT